MSNRPQKKPKERATRDGAAGEDGRDAVLERGFSALRQLRESTRAEALPERLKAVVEKLRRRE